MYRFCGVRAERSKRKEVLGKSAKNLHASQPNINERDTMSRFEIAALLAFT